MLERSGRRNTRPLETEEALCAQENTERESRSCLESETVRKKALSPTASEQPRCWRTSLVGRNSLHSTCDTSVDGRENETAEGRLGGHLHQDGDRGEPWSAKSPVEEVPGRDCFQGSLTVGDPSGHNEGRRRSERRTTETHTNFHLDGLNMDGDFVASPGSTWKRRALERTAWKRARSGESVEKRRAQEDSTRLPSFCLDSDVEPKTALSPIASEPRSLRLSVDLEGNTPRSLEGKDVLTHDMGTGEVQCLLHQSAASVEPWPATAYPTEPCSEDQVQSSLPHAKESETFFLDRGVRSHSVGEEETVSARAGPQRPSQRRTTREEGSEAPLSARQRQSERRSSLQAREDARASRELDAPLTERQRGRRLSQEAREEAERRREGEVAATRELDAPLTERQRGRRLSQEAREEAERRREGEVAATRELDAPLTERQRGRRLSQDAREEAERRREGEVIGTGRKQRQDRGLSQEQRRDTHPEVSAEREVEPATAERTEEVSEEVEKPAQFEGVSDRSALVEQRVFRKVFEEAEQLEASCCVSAQAVELGQVALRGSSADVLDTLTQVQNPAQADCRVSREVTVEETTQEARRPVDADRGFREGTVDTQAQEKERPTQVERRVSLQVAADEQAGQRPSTVKLRMSREEDQAQVAEPPAKAERVSREVTEEDQAQVAVPPATAERRVSRVVEEQRHIQMHLEGTLDQTNRLFEEGEAHTLATAHEPHAPPAQSRPEVSGNDTVETLSYSEILSHQIERRVHPENAIDVQPMEQSLTQPDRGRCREVEVAKKQPLGPTHIDRHVAKAKTELRAQIADRPSKETLQSRVPTETLTEASVVRAERRSPKRLERPREIRKKETDARCTTQPLREQGGERAQMASDAADLRLRDGQRHRMMRPGDVEEPEQELQSETSLREAAKNAGEGGRGLDMERPCDAARVETDGKVERSRKAERHRKVVERSRKVDTKPQGCRPRETEVRRVDADTKTEPATDLPREAGCLKAAKAPRRAEHRRIEPRETEQQSSPQHQRESNDRFVRAEMAEAEVARRWAEDSVELTRLVFHEWGRHRDCEKIAPAVVEAESNESTTARNTPVETFALDPPIDASEPAFMLESSMHDSFEELGKVQGPGASIEALTLERPRGVTQVDRGRVSTRGQPPSERKPPETRRGREPPMLGERARVIRTASVTPDSTRTKVLGAASPPQPNRQVLVSTPQQRCRTVHSDSEASTKPRGSRSNSTPPKPKMASQRVRAPPMQSWERRLLESKQLARVVPGSMADESDEDSGFGCDTASRVSDNESVHSFGGRRNRIDSSDGQGDRVRVFDRPHRDGKTRIQDRANTRTERTCSQDSVRHSDRGARERLLKPRTVYAQPEPPAPERPVWTSSAPSRIPPRLQQLYDDHRQRIVRQTERQIEKNSQEMAQVTAHQSRRRPDPNAFKRLYEDGMELLRKREPKHTADNSRGHHESQDVHQGSDANAAQRCFQLYLEGVQRQEQRGKHQRVASHVKFGAHEVLYEDAQDVQNVLEPCAEESPPQSQRFRMQDARPQPGGLLCVPKIDREQSDSEHSEPHSEPLPSHNSLESFDVLEVTF